MRKLGKALLRGAAASLLFGAMALPAAAQDDKDTLRVGMYTNSGTLGDVYGKNFIWPHLYWWEGSYDSFVRVDDSGNVLPFAAESWENINPTTWRVTFRKDTVFWNRRKNTAANVGKTFDYLLNTVAGNAAGILLSVKLASYKVIDDYTLEFVTEQPDPIFIPKLAAFYVVDMDAFNDMGVGEFAVHPVASGPFEILSWTDQEQISVAFDKSWRPPHVKNMHIINVPEAATRVAGLLSGELDMAYALGPDDVARIRAEGHTVAVESAPFAAAFGLFTVDFSGKWGGNPPFADRRVRQAVNYALNKEAMVNDLLLGMAKPSGQPAVPTTFGYNPDVKPYPYDPAKARQLLAEAGYADGLSVLMEPSTVYGAATDIFQIVAQDLAKVGIDVTINLQPYNERAKMYFGDSWNGEMTSFTSFYSPPQDASIVFTVFGCDLPNTFTCIPKLTPLIKAQSQEMDPDKRLAILRELMKLSHDEALSLFLFEGFDITGIAKRVSGYKNWNKVIHYENMSIE